METTLRVYDQDGTRLGVLPWSSLSRTIVRNQPGALTSSVPRSLIEAGLVEDGLRFLRVAENGVEAPDWYVLDDDGDDDADSGGEARPVAIGGTGVGQILDWANVYSWEYVPLGGPPPPDPVREAAIRAGEQLVEDRARLMALRLDQLARLRDQGAPAQELVLADTQVRDARNQWLVARADLDQLLADAPPAGSVLNLDPSHGFADATPGHIFATFLDAAKARGCFPYLTYSFDAEVDSAGTPWPYSYARNYELGTSLLKVLDQMVEDGWVDWEFVGFRLDLYVADTALALDKPETILRLGESVRQAPRKRSRKGARSVILANGAEGAAVELSDPEALAKWGRREGYEGRNGITDVGTLTAATQVSLARARSASESFTLELTSAALVPELPRPGGYVRYDRRRLSPTSLEPLRVQSIAWEYGADAKVSIEVNDLWVDNDIKRARQLDTILNGSSANERVPQQDAGDDKVPPGQVLGVAATSDAYLDGAGREQAQVTATWLEVVQDADGTAINDLLGYDIQWRQPDVDPSLYIMRVGVVTLHQWSPVVSNTQLDLRVRAVDRYNNPGAWSDWQTIQTGRDVTPPPRPSAPEVANYLGLLSVYWDGTFVGGAGRPSDFSHVQVHVSPLDGFEPDPLPAAEGGTLVGTMATEGTIYRDAPYGLTRYVKLVPVDFSGNVGDASDQDSATTGKVVEDDIFDGAVGEAKLKDLAVKTAKIDYLAVNTQQVGSIEVGKIVAGTVTAQWIMGGRITTADPGPSGTAKRVELNSLGIYRWDGVASEPVVAIDNNGALITGLYRTARTGRRIEMGVSGTLGRLTFYGAAGEEQWITSSTWVQGNGNVVECLQFRAGDQALIMATEDNTAHLWAWTLGATYRDAWSVWRGASNLVDNQVRKLALTDTDEFIVEPTNNIHLRTDQSLWLTSRNNVTHMRWATGAGWMELRGGDQNTSPSMELRNNAGWGARLQFFTTGGSDAQRIESRWGGNDGWMAIWAQAFVVQSDIAGKAEIADVERASLLDDVRSTPVSSYRRRAQPGPGADRRRAAAPLGPTEIGLIAQQAPERIQAGLNADGERTIDLYQMSATNWGATAELADLVEAQGRELAELRALVATLTGDKPIKPPARRATGGRSGGDAAR